MEKSKKVQKWAEKMDRVMNVENGEARAAMKCGKAIGPNCIPVEVFGINIA